MMKIIGLTGPSGAGKSTIAALSKEMGFSVIDCDKIAKVTSNKPEVLRAVEKTFGSHLIKDGKLDRKELAKIAFSDEKSTALLNSIMLPPIVLDITAECKELKKKGVKAVILDAPTLFESGLGMTCDETIAVLATHDTRKERITSRDELNEQQVSYRLNAAKPEEYFTERTKYIIYNNGTKDELIDTAKTMLTKIITKDGENG